MSRSDDWELQRQATMAPVDDHEVALRTFWGTLVAGVIGIAVISCLLPGTERKPKRGTDKIQVAASEPQHNVAARHEDSEEVSEPVALPEVAEVSVASEPAPVTPVVPPPERLPEVAQTIPSVPETIPEPVLLPEEPAPVALAAEATPAPANEIISPATAAQPPVAETPTGEVPVAAAQVALDEPPEASEAVDLSDVKAKSIDGPRPGSVAAFNAQVQFHARRYTLTCPHCRAQQTEAADCIADRSSFRCLSCDAKIKVRELHERLENEQKHARKLARR
jgi:hypothetical protein